MNDIAINDESAEKLRRAQGQLAHWEGNLSKLEARLNDLEASAGTDAQARAEAAIRILADEDDHAAREYLNELDRRANERRALREALPQARTGILREIAIAKRRLELSEAFAKAGAKLVRFDEITATAEKFDALAPQLATITAEMEAAAQDLRAAGVEVPSPPSAYVVPVRSAADLAREAFTYFEQSYARAKAALEAFESNPVPPEELHEQQRRLWAQQAEAERLQKIADERRKEDDAIAAREKEIAERKRRQQENMIIIRPGEFHGRVVDIGRIIDGNQSRGG